MDELIPLDALWQYMVAFVGAAYHNPPSFCPQHQMRLPRAIKG